MDNTYNIDFIARCIAGHNKTAIKSIATELENVQKQVGSVSLVEITQEDFDALTDKDPSTIYLVSNGDKITLYIGGTEVNVQSNWAQTTITADDYIKNKPTLGTAAAKNATDTYNATGTDVTTGKAVAAALATLPEPMVFKGSLGTGGTITTLPTASSSNKGYVYKVITAGIYANLSAKVGDTFISDGSTWVLIPSGDEPSGTVTNVAVANGGGLTVSGSPITSSGTITVGHSNSVTAKTSSSLKKFTYDAYGHVTGSSELSTAESNALASGIDSTKVAQIETNENNILTVADQTTKYNLLNQAAYIELRNVTYSNGVVTQVNADTRSNLVMQLSLYNGSTFITQLAQATVKTNGIVSIPFTYSQEANLIRIGHSGANIDARIAYAIPTDFVVGNKYYFVCTINNCEQVIDDVTTPYSWQNMTIIPKAIYDSGFTSYQLYAMSNAELTAAIQAIQAQLATNS